MKYANKLRIFFDKHKYFVFVALLIGSIVLNIVVTSAVINARNTKSIEEYREVGHILESINTESKIDDVLSAVVALNDELLLLRGALDIKDSLYLKAHRDNVNAIQSIGLKISKNSFVASTPSTIKAPTSKKIPKASFSTRRGRYARGSAHRIKDLKYIDNYKHIAINEQKKFGIPASIKLAQGLIESNGGASKLAKYNNHFGMKKIGKSFLYETSLAPMIKDQTAYLRDDCCELQGKPKGCDCTDSFFIFDRVWASYRAHSLLLVKAGRYKPCFELEVTDYKGWAHQLKKSGYATASKYAETVIDVIEQYNLDQYDTVD